MSNFERLENNNFSQKAALLVLADVGISLLCVKLIRWSRQYPHWSNVLKTIADVQAIAEDTQPLFKEVPLLNQVEMVKTSEITEIPEVTVIRPSPEERGFVQISTVWGTQ